MIISSLSYFWECRSAGRVHNLDIFSNSLLFPGIKECGLGLMWSDLQNLGDPPLVVLYNFFFPGREITFNYSMHAIL